MANLTNVEFTSFQSGHKTGHLFASNKPQAFERAYVKLICQPCAWLSPSPNKAADLATSARLRIRAYGLVSLPLDNARTASLAASTRTFGIGLP